MDTSQKRIVWGLSRSQPLVVDGSKGQAEAVLALLRSGEAELVLTAQGRDAVHRFTTAEQAKFANPEDLNADGQKDEPNVETGLKALKPAAASKSKTSKEQKSDGKATRSVQKS